MQTLKNVRSLALLIFITSCSAPGVRAPAGLSLDTRPQAVADSAHYDVIIVGAGLAGLSSAIYLTDAGKKVLLLEREKTFGGLAAWAERKDRIRYDRGAAYWTDAYEEEMAILKRIGLANFMKKYPIPDPIDSYYVAGKFYNDIWAPRTVAKLPASFALFKYGLERANDDNKIPNQPFEDFEKYGGTMELDGMNARAWIEGMPAAMDASIAKLENIIADSPPAEELAELQKKAAEGRKIQARFQSELRSGKLKGATGMEAILELLDLYCRSALGNTADHVSAMAFANFYISEIVTRYTSPQGTGIAADKMMKILAKLPDLFVPKSGTPVVSVRQTKDQVETIYAENGQVRSAVSSYVIFASQLNQAAKIIEGFERQAPLQASMMTNLGYSHYSVHAVTVAGQPYRASYDTWTRAADYSEDDFTDVILGLWVNPKMMGYKGYRDFKKDPPIKDSILTIYQPLSQEWLKREYSEAEGKKLAERAVERVRELYTKLPPTLWRGPLKVKKLETNRWPFSVHIAEPGHYVTKAKILRQPFGRVYFAHSNMGTPAFEEALFRGHCAADNVLKRLDAKFEREPWSRCPMDPVD